MAFNKRINDLVAADLDALKAATVREGKTIEYKERISIETDDNKRKFLALVASFSNSSGGDIVFGIRAIDGVPKDLVALKNFEPDRDIRTLRDIVRAHIDPPLFGVEFKEISIEGGMVLVVRIPRGWGGSHMVTFNGDNRFYTRDANGCVKMNVSEIRSSFLQSESIAERIRRFRFERLNNIKSAEGVVTLVDGAKWVLHLVPVRAFEPGRLYDLRLVENVRGFQPMTVASGWNTTHDLDGIYAFESHQDKPSWGYSAVLRNGCVEVVQCFGGSRELIPNPHLEAQLMGAYANSIEWLPLVNGEPPVVVAVSLLDVKGRILAFGHRNPLFGMRPVRHDDLIIHDVLAQSFEAIRPAELLRPIFDAIWQACGMQRSFNFEESGIWKPQVWQ